MTTAQYRIDYRTTDGWVSVSAATYDEAAQFVARHKMLLGINCHIRLAA